jgi:signal transduction histidine kinase
VVPVQRWWWSRSVDALICAAVLASGLVEVLAPLGSRQGDGSPLLSTIQVATVGVALWWRRTHPLATAVAVCAGLWLTVLVGPSYVLFYGQFVPIMVATFSVARHGVGRQPYVGGAVTAATLLYADLFIEELQATGEVIFHWGVLVVCWAFGSWQRVMAHHAETSRRRAIEVEVEAAERTLSAVLEERARIARELHDIVAHSMSVMVVQAGAAEQVVAEDPEHARQALRQIRQTGIGALAEMRRLVSVLREPDEAGPLTPQPGLAAVAALVDEVRAAGLPIALTVSGEPRELPAGLDLTAYRIVQEALTNVRRHAAGATAVTVTLVFEGDNLRIDVRDDGPGAAATTGTGGGHGLIGMRERVQLYGGRLRAATLPGRGFQVTADLPLASA